MSRPAKPIVPGIFILVLSLYGCRSVQSVSDIPSPPKGYRSLLEVQAAIVLGKLELVDLKPPVPETIESMTAITYRVVDGARLKLDIYRPRNNATPAPVLVFIHGGSWKSGDRADYLPYLIDYAKKGYVTVSVSYRFQQQAKFPAAVSDVLCALSWIADHASEYTIDPNRIGLVGGSAGAHLALMAAYAGADDDPVPVACVVDFYGPVDLRTDFAIGHPTVEAFLGSTYVENPEVYRQASPIVYLSKDAPPTLIFHGTIDDTVPVNQSDLLREALDEAGVPVEYHRLDGWPHMMDAAKRVNMYCQYYMDAFFERHLR